MKNVYMVQVDFTANDSVGSFYLPYATGLLCAYAWTDDFVRQTYNFGGFIYKRTDIDKVLKKIKEPAVVGFSNYVWNTEYNKTLAKKIKKKYPDCKILFGGHNVPDDVSMLKDYGFIDILMYSEGEESFLGILKALENGGLEDVYNIAFRKDGEIIRTKRKAPTHLDYPSPYLDGWFDEIIEENRNTAINAILETSRGCPNHCAYCDWGVLRSKTRLFPLERVLAEIRWMSEHKISFIWGADANFGMFERDLKIVEELVRCKKENGYPERMRINYSKTNYENVFNISKMLRDYDFDNIGATLSFQSFNEDVLHNIGRTNMSHEMFKKIYAKYRETGTRTYSELILGLPGETYRSFISGLAEIFRLGQHFVFEIYPCIILPNAELGRADMLEKFSIKTVPAQFVRSHCEASEFDLPEYNNIVVETNTLSREEWIRASVFYNLVKSFHGYGLLRLFAIYLYYEKGIAYEDFYDDLLTFLHEKGGPVTNGIYNEVYSHIEGVSRGVTDHGHIFEPYGNTTWFDYEWSLLNFLYKKDEFYEEIKPYLLTFGIDDNIFRQLFEYQKAIVRSPYDKEIVLRTDYDFTEYFDNIYADSKKELQKGEFTTRLFDAEFCDNWPDFGKYVVWYGRMGWKSYKKAELL